MHTIQFKRHYLHLEGILCSKNQMNFFNHLKKSADLINLGIPVWWETAIVVSSYRISHLYI